MKTGRSRLRIHLLEEKGGWTFCGRRDVPRTTADPAEATCRLSADGLNEALASPEDSKWVHRRARQWARSRAVGRLVEAHRDELDRLIANELPAALAESIDLERRMRARTD